MPRWTRRWPGPANVSRVTVGPGPCSTRRCSPRARRSLPPRTTSRRIGGPSAARPGPGSRRPSGGWSGPGSWPARTIHRVRWPRPIRPTRWPGRRGAWPKTMCGRTGTGTVRAVYKEGAAGSAVRFSAGSSSADSWAAAGAAGATEGVRRRIRRRGIRRRRRARQLRRRGHSRPTGRRRPLLNHRQSMHGEGTHGSVPRS